MYLDYFGLQQPPFSPDAPPAFFHADAARQELLGALAYAARHGDGIIKLTGERGSGLTMLGHALARQLAGQAEVVQVQAEQLNPLGIVHALAIGLEINPDGKLSDEVMRLLHTRLELMHAAGRSAVLLVEQADTLPPQTLEEIRQLTNLEAPPHKLLQVVLAGQPALSAMLKQPAMKQLRERITLSFVMPPMAAADVAGLLAHRLRAAGREGPDVFGPDAVQALAGAAHGDLRRLMALADAALQGAAAAQSPAVTAAHVAAAGKGASALGTLVKRPVLVGVLAALAVVGAGIAAVASRQPAPVARQEPMAMPAAPKPPPAAAPASTADSGAAVAAGETPPNAPPNAPQNTPPSTPPSAPATHAPAASAAAEPVVVAPPPKPGAAVPPASPPQAAQVPPAPPIQAAATAAAPAAAPAQTLHAAPPPAPASQAKAAAKPPQAAGGALLQQSLRDTRAWLKNEPADNYSIQIENVAAKDAAKAEAFLHQVRAAMGSLDNVHAYPMLADGERRIAIVYGSYRSARQALDTQSVLTERWGARPKMRTIKGIRSAIAKAG